VNRIPESWNRSGGENCPNADAPGRPATLDGQRAADRRDEVALRYGPIDNRRLPDSDVIRQRVRKTLPFRLFRDRSWRLTSADTYRGRIPETALCRLGEAQESHLFEQFVIAEPTYGGSRLVADPWLLGGSQSRANTS
jgi:hypothetical protein